LKELSQKKQKRYEYNTIYNSLPRKKIKSNSAVLNVDSNSTDSDDIKETQTDVYNSSIVITAELPIPRGKIPIPSAHLLIEYPFMAISKPLEPPPLIPMAWFIPLIKIN
jgi:hypothetical protein